MDESQQYIVDGAVGHYSRVLVLPWAPVVAAQLEPVLLLAPLDLEEECKYMCKTRSSPPPLSGIRHRNGCLGIPI